jgi:DNA-binding winged helix-turn-helix (wHTH) protein/Tol biopolymer transport system component
MIVFSGAQVNRSSAGVWLNFQLSSPQTLTRSSEEIARALERDWWYTCCALLRGCARVKASSKRSSGVRFGQFELDLPEERLLKRGLPVRLENQPFQILAALLEHPGDMVSREELCARLWPDGTYVDFDEGLNTAIKKLRYALGDSADNATFIETVPRRGYRFIAPVTSNASDERGAISDPSVLPEREDQRPTEDGENRFAPTAGNIAESSPQSSTVRRTWRTTAAVVFALIVIAGFIGYSLRQWIQGENRPNFERLRFTKLTSSGKAEDAAISPDGNFIVYSQRDHNGTGLRLRQVLSGSDVQIVRSEEPDFRGLTFSPDGNSIYFVRERKETYSWKDLYAMPILGGSSRLLTKDIDSPVSFSPDGHHFVYTRGIGPPDANEIRVANADGSEDHLLAAIPATSVSFQPGAAWSPNGGTIAISLMLRGQRSGYVLDSISTVDGSVREVLWNAGVIGRPLWLPEGDKVLVDVDDPTGRGQLWTVSISHGERRRVTNDLANWGIQIDTTRDSKSVVAVQWSLSANIWESSAANPTAAQPITSGDMPLVAAVAATAAKILAVSGDGRLWIVRENGMESRRFSNLRDVAPPVMCGQFAVLTSYASGRGEDSQADAGSINGTKMSGGRFVVQRSYQSGPASIVRIDADGVNATALASGLVYSPTCSPDGKFLFYVSMGSSEKILRMSIEGGESTVVGEVPGRAIRGTMRVSPDGQFLAFPYDLYVPRPALKLAVISTKGRIEKHFDSPPGVYREACLRWSPDGRALQYLLTQGDVTNIWEQPLAGGSPKRITDFTSGRIFDFNWSPDGTQLLMSRGEVSSDVVLLSNLR